MNAHLDGTSCYDDLFARVDRESWSRAVSSTKFNTRGCQGIILTPRGRKEDLGDLGTELVES